MPLVFEKSFTYVVIYSLYSDLVIFIGRAAVVLLCAGLELCQRCTLDYLGLIGRQLKFLLFTFDLFF